MNRPIRTFDDFRMPSATDLLMALGRIESSIHYTPVLTCSLLNERLGAELFFKCDNFQKAGSYKIRGATNAILQLSTAAREKGVATHSSGNFAQALARAARHLGVQAYIIMPDNAPKVKIAAVRDYGATVILCPSTLQDREAALAEVVKTKGATPIHPSNDTNVIIGQGTMAYELIHQVPDLDYILSPVGGGGVAAGTCLATKYFSPMTKVIGAEPLGADDAYKSLLKGEIVPSFNPQTIADGLRTQLGDKNFPIIYQYIDQIIRVSESNIVEAMRLVWERMKIIIEPSSATTLAAIMTEPSLFEGKRVGLIITGGNVTLDKYFEYMYSLVLLS